MLSKLHVVAGGLRLLCDVAIEIVQFANPSDLRGIGLCLFFAAELQVAGSALEIKLALYRSRAIAFEKSATACS